MAKWKKSAAKAMLYKDILEGRLPLMRQNGDPTYETILATSYAHLPAFQEGNHGDPGKFGSRLRSLRKQIASKHDRATVDSNALANDRLLFPEVPEDDGGWGYQRWGGSVAQALLKADVDAGLHKQMLPADLFNTRPEYQQYPPKVFRNHIYQEVKSRKKHVKKKKAKIGGVEEASAEY
jgi:hypothetical protein